MSGLFVRKDFTSNAGLELHWKIECDALDDGDWEALAQIAVEILPAFREVIGVPRGGLAFANRLRDHVNQASAFTLIADDVLTTGGSMERQKVALGPRGHYIGVVAFSRCHPYNVPAWITPLFQIAVP